MNLKQSRVPVPLRKELVAAVKSSLKPGMDFNAVYGQVLYYLEQTACPSMEEARLLLRNPEALLAAHAEKKAATLQAKERLKAQIINANIPQLAPQRQQLVAETLAFVNRFPKLTIMEVKAVTLLRQENGNRDPRVVSTYEITTPDALGDDLANAQKLETSVGNPGARFSASCQIFLLKEGEHLQHEFQPPIPELAALD